MWRRNRVEMKIRHSWMNRVKEQTIRILQSDWGLKHSFNNSKKFRKLYMITQLQAFCAAANFFFFSPPDMSCLCPETIRLTEMKTSPPTKVCLQVSNFISIAKTSWKMFKKKSWTSSFKLILDTTLEVTSAG